MSKSGIYSITNTVNGKRYIGSTSDFEKRKSEHYRYLRNEKHINIILQRAYVKYGEDNLVFGVLEVVEDLDTLRDREQYWIDHFSSSIILYNLSDAYNGGDLISNHPNKDEIIRKRRNTQLANMKAMSPEERKEKWSKSGSDNPMYGKTHSKESRKKISEAHKGKKHALGLKRSDDTKAKLSEIAKERIGTKNPFYGKSHSDETKKKISEVHKGKIPPNRRKIVADGIEYDSLSDCAKKLGITTPLVLYRLKSDKYDYYYL